MSNILSLIEKINENNKKINELNSSLIDMKVKEVTDLIQKSVKHLTFSPIPNVSEFNIKNIYGNITSIRSLCNHALLLDSFTPSSFTDFYYAEHGEGTYELG